MPTAQFAVTIYYILKSIISIVKLCYYRLVTLLHIVIQRRYAFQPSNLSGQTS